MKRRTVILALLLLALLACARAEQAAFELSAVPEALLAPCAQQGSVERLEYETFVYDKRGNPGRAGTGRACVYLPSGYDSAQRYDVLYLMHGAGEDERYWLSEENGARALLDGMIAQGLCPPVIVVTPCLASEKNGGLNGTGTFRHELRGDLIPAVESRYSTWAGGDTSLESLTRSRAHRAYAGLSLGSEAGWSSVLMGCLDIIGYVGCFSGYYANAYAIAESMNTAYADFPPLYWYNGNGTLDGSHDDHLRGYGLMLRLCPQLLREGENCCFADKPGKRHNLESWRIDLYNVMRVFFRAEAP